MSPPPLILLSGTLCDAQLWTPMLKQLRVRQVRCLIPEGEKSALATAQRLLAQLPPRFCLAGFSLGAMVALHMLALAPHRIAGLALMAVNPFPLPPDSLTPRRAVMTQAQAMGLREFVLAQLWPRYVANARLQDIALRDTILDMAERCGINTFISQTELSLRRHDCREAVRKFQRPLLLLSGDQDSICPAKGHQALAELASHAHWQEFHQCGHFLPLEAPDRCASALTSWYEEVKECEAMR